MAIYSIGHDIVENNRIGSLIEEHGIRFINRVLSESEKEVFATKTDQIKYVAKRYAAKEAFAKACGTGLRDPILMPKISICNDALGKPFFELDTLIIDYLSQIGVNKWHLSISDEITLSSAFVILEKRHE
jgi:holo-[acyl-carrier protein] synthase